MNGDTAEIKPEAAVPGGRLLWMTDTYGDHNGVSTVLRAIHREIKARNLPVDLMICSNQVQPDDHLIVVRPVSEFTIPVYRQQKMRIPNYLSVQRWFRRGNYTRIICSTEGPMGFAALWLKNVFSVETSFYLHTDWMTFAQDALSLEKRGLNRLQRALRIYYKRYDSVFVLNTEQQQWLTGAMMRFDPSRVFLTAHWADPVFSETGHAANHDFLFERQRPVLLYAGRISREKGVMELPGIYGKIKSVFPEVQMVVAGTGPAEDELKAAMPDAFYHGWVGMEQLPDLYRAADILLLPSRFDTFSCVVLEALSCGLPVAAYNTKGPKDILEHNVSGYLVETGEEMAGSVVGFFLDPAVRDRMKKAARLRAEFYQSETIMNRLLCDAGLITEPAE